MQYEKPSVEDFGTLRELTAMAFPGLAFEMASLSSPLVPGGPPGGPDNPGPSSSGGGDLPPGSTPGSGVAGGENASGGGGAESGGVAGAEMGGGGGAAASTGGGDASLPFTGFPAAMVGALGAGMAACGAALRRALGRSQDE